MTGTLNFKCKIAFNSIEEARRAGYAESGKCSYQSGYISRRAELRTKDDNKVYIAGKGAQAGKLFYLMPAQNSTRYCMRVYLEKRGAVE